MNFWTDPLKVAAEWLEGILTGWGMDAIFAHVLVVFLGVLLLITILMVLDIFLVWIERKVVSRFQDRIGPNRVGPYGLIQPFADIIKLIIKEDTTPDGADKVVYNLAPILSMMSVLIVWAVVPIAPVILGTDLNVGVLFLIAAGAIGTLSIIMAGWSSNNKFALIGGFRQVAMMVAFEIPMLTMLLIPTIFAGSMNMNAIIQAQGSIWYFFLSPLGTLIFLIAVIAELGRAPFDLAEGESELVAGYNTEYSGMKFGMFYAGELLHAMTFGGIWGILFFGGYRFFGLEQVSPFLAVLIFLAKALIGYWVIMWVKYTMMRIRIDQMLAFNWMFLTPLSFVLLMVTALANALLAGTSIWVYGIGMFASNIILGWVALEIVRSYSRKEREKLEGPRKVAEAHH
ncbi:MAG: NADH-quinone oxidoreductase subunit H [Anaerolineales bacterium]|nr:NADH-quinone oxidoreductase subunit H [Anaerolineales bacterium]